MKQQNYEKKSLSENIMTTKKFIEDTNDQRIELYLDISKLDLHERTVYSTPNDIFQMIGGKPPNV